MTKDPPEKTVCRTPTPGKKPTRIDTWKFELFRGAILSILNENPEGYVFMELPREIGKRLTAAEKKKLGSVGWYTATVKLELEVRGEIERVPRSSPQILILADR